MMKQRKQSLLSIEGKENIEQGTVPVFDDSKNNRSIK